jgi:hypothetical protein
MATSNNNREQGLSELFHTNQEMHRTMLDMSSLLGDIVYLMRRDPTAGAPDVEHGVTMG